MLLDKLFFIEREHSEEGKYQYQIRIHAEHEVFAGHFPGNAIVPGVCMVQLVADLLAHTFSHRYKLKAARDIKFLNPIATKELQYFTMDLTINVDVPDALYPVTALIHAKDKQFFKLKGTYLREA